MCSHLRSNSSLYAPSLPFLLPMLSKGALGELLPVSGRLLLSVQVPQGLHQVGGSSWVTCKTHEDGFSLQKGRSRSPALLGVAKAAQKPDEEDEMEKWCNREEIVPAVCHRL